MAINYKLFEKEPAVLFEDAHLLGNGSLGATVFGGVPFEKILINHDTLWSGQESVKVSPKTKENFPEARRLVMDGKLREANDLIMNEMLGYWSESYMPLGYLNITMNHLSDQRTMKQKELLRAFPVTNYSRTLTLSDAVERIEYDQMGRHYTREIFVSQPDNIIAVRLTASGGSLDFSASMDSPLRHEAMMSGSAIIGRAPDRVENYDIQYTPVVGYNTDAESDSIRFAAASRIIDTDGEVSCDNFRTYVKNAGYAVIIVSACTNFKGVGVARDKNAALLIDKCGQFLDNASAKEYELLKQAHISEYKGYYDRYTIDLGNEITGILPTSDRMRMFRTIHDPSFIALITQYTRYLLISFSRPGTQAGNLQGIWNPSVNPPWASNYTTNINVQMNYWIAEVLNLSDCHLPMSDLIRELSVSGQTAAKETYGMDGWVTHHNTDLWRFAALAGEEAAWSWWAFGGFWMCEHMWQHFEFTGDTDYLRNEIYPVFREAARFICDFVVKDTDGYYVTPPSTSPENKFFIGDNTVTSALEEASSGSRFSPSDRKVSEVCKASTMDLAIIRELFRNLKTTRELLGVTDDLCEKTDDILANLYPFKIGKYGQLQEWDQDFEECTPGMGHISHMYPVFPADIITKRNNPELFDAAQISIIRRSQHGGGTRGWPAAWKICLYARFGDGVYCNLLNGGIADGLGANMLSKGRWQIDAIMGWGAGIAEMLLQSHDGAVELLPALPPSWLDGEISGMRARGGFDIGMKWRNGILESVTVSSEKGGNCTLRYGETEVSVTLLPGEVKTFGGDLR